METEISLTIGDVQYLLIAHNTSFIEVAAFASSANPEPMIVYPTQPGESISRTTLQQFRSSILDQDNVFQPQFLQNVLFHGSKEDDLTIKADAYEELDAWNTKTFKFAGKSPAYKADNGFTLLSLDKPEAGTNGRVIVPSRCYFKPSISRPLDGARISVKDNIDIAGHKTTLCNKAWQTLYPEKEKNAACVQVLIDAGAIIVGKSKLQAMIMREEPKEAVEFTSPFNPRADGYQVPSGSSNGSAAGIGSYDWLDFSLGSDTNGSGRKPAQYNGCFSIRPSTGIMNTDGVVGHFPQFDMPVFFGRDLSRFPEFIDVWYGKSPLLKAPSKLPIKILYPHDYLPTVNQLQSNLIERFVKGLEGAFEVQREVFSLAEEWIKDCPDGPKHEDIIEYLELAGGYPYYHDSYRSLEPFRSEYKERYGKAPFVHNAMRWQWEASKDISIEERDEYWRRSEIYRHWLLEKIFKAQSEDSISVMVFPIEIGRPNYRDGDIPPMSILSGFDSLNMSPMMRGPEVTALVGQIPFLSKVTGREEPLPIAVSVIGTPGTDLILARVVEKGVY
ncbi:amidase [Penicillium angulare]|uniref:Amidase n=1 Tax=Penicillium angulare TaxID=116970 RepID=A0A9W9F3H7_9EURO|nr:amidase [Penicillium angulare]